MSLVHLKFHLTSPNKSKGKKWPFTTKARFNLQYRWYIDRFGVSPGTLYSDPYHTGRYRSKCTLRGKRQECVMPTRCNVRRRCDQLKSPNRVWQFSLGAVTTACCTPMIFHGHVCFWGGFNGNISFLPPQNNRVPLNCTGILRHGGWHQLSTTECDLTYRNSGSANSPSWPVTACFFHMS